MRCVLFLLRQDDLGRSLTWSVKTVCHVPLAEKHPIMAWLPSTLPRDAVFANRTSPNSYSCNSINMISIAIWRCDSNYIAVTGRLGEGTIFLAEDGTLIIKCPQVDGFLCSLLHEVYFSQFFDQDFLGAPQKTECQKKKKKRSGYLFYFFPCETYTGYSVGPRLRESRAYAAFFLLFLLIRVERAQPG